MESENTLSLLFFMILSIIPILFYFTLKPSSCGICKQLNGFTNMLLLQMHCIVSSIPGEQRTALNSAAKMLIIEYLQKVIDFLTIYYVYYR